MRTRSSRRFATALAVVLGTTTLACTVRPAAAASEDTWRYATYGAAGVAAYGLVKKSLPIAAIGAAGAYLAHKKWKGEVEDRHDRERPGYGRGSSRDGRSGRDRLDTRYNDRSNRRSGDYRADDYRSGDYRNGDYRSGDYRSGDYRNGDYRNGDYRNGDYRNGDYRNGDYRNGDYRNGDSDYESPRYRRTGTGSYDSRTRRGSTYGTGRRAACDEKD